MAGTRKFFHDLLLVAGLVILTDICVLLTMCGSTSIRTALSLVMMFFLPGYALIAALFPAKSDLDGIERTALSFGLSIAVVPLIGLGLNYTLWGIRLLPVLASLSAFIFVMCGVAYLRRAKLPETEAFAVHFKKTALSLKSEILKKPGSKLDKGLNVFLIFSVFLSIATFLVVMAFPEEGEHFTEFYILGPGGMADNYPTEYVLGEKGTLVIGIVNHEYRPVNYTIEAKLENKPIPLSESMRRVTLAHNETWEEQVIFTPPFEGENMRFELLLFNENKKDVPYRDLHLWINVAEKAGET